MQSRPKGIRFLFWKFWGWRLNLKLKTKFKQLERKGHFGPRTVANVTTNILNEEAQKLYDAKAINNNLVFWNGAWVACEVRRK